jgi:DNA-binding CsgD family transcriptional regulator
MDDLARARAATATGDWVTAYELFAAADPGRLTTSDHDLHADAAWWTSRIDASIAARQRAHAGHLAAGDVRPAGVAAWMLFYEHQMAGRPAAASGWLARARRHLTDDCLERCYLLWTDADAARAAGDLDTALASAREMVDLARSCGGADLAAAGIYTEGEVLIAAGRRADGLARLDEALCVVLAGELSPMFTGWIYCLGLQTCMALGEVGRVAEWTEAAMAWCDSLPTGNNPFLGLCRVHRVELLSLRGAWDDARAEADAVESVYPSVVAEASYVAGEVHRRRGAYDAAAAAYTRAHELGRDPQPGLALLALARGRAGDAAAAVTRALGDPGLSALARARLLSAQTEIALARGDVETARSAAGELVALAASGADLVRAAAATATGTVALAEGEAAAALVALRSAWGLWTDLGMPYEAAQARMAIAAACRAAGDREGTRLELRAARAAFARLGARPEERRAAVLAADAGSGQLTAREIEVLRLVAAGRTNREVAAALGISGHTVARHLNNIFAKLDVSSRSAATAYAYTHHLV